MSGGCDGDRPYCCDGCGKYTVTYPTAGPDNRWYHACYDCRAFVSGLPTLVWSIQRACRRAEVAGLVEDVEYHMTDAIGAAESYSPDRLRRAVADLRTALASLARLAEEVSGG